MKFSVSIKQWDQSVRKNTKQMYIQDLKNYKVVWDEPISFKVIIIFKKYNFLDENSYPTINYHVISVPFLSTVNL